MWWPKSIKINPGRDWVFHLYYLRFFILSLNKSHESILSTQCPRHPEYSAGAGCHMPNNYRVEGRKMSGGGKEK